VGRAYNKLGANCKPIIDSAAYARDDLAKHAGHAL